MQKKHPIRLTAVLTHPVQYVAPWFRYVAAHCPEIDLTVLYATAPTPEQQGVGFGRPFLWDVPLTDGYHCRTVRRPRPNDSVHSDRFFGLDVPEIDAAIIESCPDAVLLGGWHSITQCRALWACLREGIPILYRGDTHLGNRPEGWRGPAWEAKTWSLLRLFNGYLSVGQRTRTFLRHFGASESEIFDVPHCVDNDFFAAAAAREQSKGRGVVRSSLGLRADDFIVLFIGKLENKKRPCDLIKAMAPLGLGAALLLVGAGDLEKECLTGAQRLGIQVVPTGFLNQSELGRIYAAADCLALPSDWGETWGLVVNEAMAAGLPCVVSDRVGCAPDLISPGETGEIFPMGDVTALSAALERVRAQVLTGHDFAWRCRRGVKNYSFEMATEGLLRACRTVVRSSLHEGHQEHHGLDGVQVPSQRVLACCGGMLIVSGAERMTFEVLRVLQERGVSLHVIVNRWENHRIVALADEIGATWTTGYYWYWFDRHTRNPVQWLRFASDILMTSGGLLKDAAVFAPTHVLIPDFITVIRNAPALALLRLFGIRVILRLGNAPSALPFYRRLWRWVVNPAVDQFVANSDFTERELLAHGIPTRKVRHIYNAAPLRSGTTLDRQARNSGKVIYVGQIVPDKGVDLLLDALSLLAARGLDVSADIVGEMDGWGSKAYPGYTERLTTRASSPDLRGRVRFLGWRDDIPALLAAASIHCCPSRPEIREGFGLVTLEAKEAGLPSVVLPSGALPELVTHLEDGWVCREVSASALAEGLEYFLTDDKRREEAGRAARRSAERFSRKQFAESWLAMFLEPGEMSSHVWSPELTKDRSPEEHL